MLTRRKTPINQSAAKLIFLSCKAEIVGKGVCCTTGRIVSYEIQWYEHTF